jgi:hypothetical protein
LTFVARNDAVPQPATLSECEDQITACSVQIGFVNVLQVLLAPGVQLHGELAVTIVEKWPLQPG